MKTRIVIAEPKYRYPYEVQILDKGVWTFKAFSPGLEEAKNLAIALSKIEENIDAGSVVWESNN